MPDSPSLPPWPTDEEKDFWRHRCLPLQPHAYFWFARIPLGIDRYLQLPGKQKTWFRTDLHLPICDALQAAADEWLRNRTLPTPTDRQKLAFCIHRNTGKTVLGTKGLNAYLQLHDPNITATIGSETQPKASKFLRTLRALWEGSDATSQWVPLYGDWSPTDPTSPWNSNELTHRYKTTTSESEPSIGTFSVGGGITGYHPDALFYDDPLSEEKIKAEENWVQAANDSYDSVLNAVQASGFVALIGTRYRENDPMGTALSTEHVKTWVGMPNIWPTVSLTEDGRWTCIFYQARHADGTPSTPHIWSAQELTAMEQKNYRFYATQMMNDPASVADSPLTDAYLTSLELTDLPENPGYTATLHVDTAFKDDTRKKSGDETTLLAFLHANDKTGQVIFDQGYGSPRWRSSDFLTQLIRTLKDYKTRRIRIKAITDEQLPGGKTGPFWELARQTARQHGLILPPVKVITRQGTTKERRIREAESYWLAGYAKVRHGAPGWPHYKAQLLRWSVMAHDDWVDAGADVFHPTVWTRPRTPPSPDAAPPQRQPQDAYLLSGGQHNPFQQQPGAYINDPIL